MFIKETIGFVLLEKDKSIVQNLSLQYISDYLKTVYYIQSSKNDFYIISFNRVNIDIDGIIDAMKMAGVDTYIFNSNYGACKMCSSLDGLVIRVQDIVKGKNYPPIHKNCKCKIKPYLSNYLNSSFNISYSEWLNLYVDKSSLPITIEELIEFDKHKAKEKLNSILDCQYKNFAPIDCKKFLEELGFLKDSEIILAVIQNLKSLLADYRMKQAFQSIEKNRDTIIDLSNTYGIPPEYVAAIILKEQYTRSAPDWLVVLLNKIDLRKSGSTGLGAISAQTARNAWIYYWGKEKASEYLPKNDDELLKLLAEDDKLNIETIYIVSIYEASNLGIGGKDTMGSLSDNDWHRIYNKYNGDIEYANKTIEYVPYMEDLLK